MQSQTITAPGFNVTQNYLFDGVNRICAAAEAGSVGSQCGDAASGAWYEKFGYDQYGNQWVNATNLQLTSLTPTSSAWFNAATNRFNGVGYDLAGNQTGAGGGTFTFDAENRQVTAALDAPLYSQFTYGYDGEGRRVRRTVYGKTRTYVYGLAGELMAEYHNGALAKEYIYAGSRLLSVADFVDNAVTYVSTDHLGSTRLVTNASAAVESRHDYLPFGKEIPTNLSGRSSVAGYTATQNILQRFTGKELDPETGLDYFGARYFSGRQGRFTTVDPILIMTQKLLDPQQWNMYTYGRNNPLRFTDPTGRYNTDCKSRNIKDCSAEVQAFEANRQRNLQSRDRRVRAAASAYGSFNDGNKVNVKFSDNLREAGSAVQDRDSRGNRLDSITVTFREMKGGLSGRNAVAHEGSHVEDFNATMKGGKPLTLYQTELKAFLTGAAVLSDFPGMPIFLQVRSQVFMEPFDDIAAQLNKDAADRILASPDYRVTESDQGGTPYVLP